MVFCTYFISKLSTVLFRKWAIWKHSIQSMNYGDRRTNQLLPGHFFPLSQFTECSGRHLKGSWVHWTTTNHQVAFFAHDKLWTPHYINPPIYISKWVFWQTSDISAAALGCYVSWAARQAEKKERKNSNCHANVLKIRNIIRMLLIKVCNEKNETFHNVCISFLDSCKLMRLLVFT